MSLQDDIFDVAHALEGKPEAVLFEEICTTFFKFEEQADQFSSELRQLKESLYVVGKYLNASQEGKK